MRHSHVQNVGGLHTDKLKDWWRKGEYFQLQNNSSCKKVEEAKKVYHRQQQR